MKSDPQITPPVRAMMSVLLLVIKLLMAKSGLNRRNSSIPPSQDQNRQRLKKASAKSKAGGQPGRKGVILKPVENPDKIETLKVDRRTLPQGH